MPILNRQYGANYRLGFNKGSEKDNEIYGEGNAYSTFYRELDIRLGIWWGIDPKYNHYEGPYISMDQTVFYQIRPAPTMQVAHWLKEGLKPFDGRFAPENGTSGAWQGSAGLGIMLLNGTIQGLYPNLALK